MNDVNELSSAGWSGTLTVAGTAGEFSGNATYDPGVTNVVVNSQSANVYEDGSFAADGFTPSSGPHTYTAVGKDMTSALADYNKAIELNPDWAEIYGNRAEAEAALSDLNQAEADSAEAANLNPNLTTNAATAFHFLGWLRYEKREYTNALSDFQEACKLNPSDDYSHFGIWLCSSMLGSSDKATVELKDYLANRQNVASDDWVMEIGEFLTGEITEEKFAEDAENTNTEIDKEKHGEAYFYIGCKRLIAGDKHGAAAFFKKCLAVGTQGFSEYQTAKAELRALEKAN